MLDNIKVIATYKYSTFLMSIDNVYHLERSALFRSRNALLQRNVASEGGN